MRVLLSVPITVSGKSPNDQIFIEDTRTLVVNAHGALISLGAPVAAEQKITVWEASRREKRRWALSS